MKQQDEFLDSVKEWKDEAIKKSEKYYIDVLRNHKKKRGRKAGRLAVLIMLCILLVVLLTAITFELQEHYGHKRTASYVRVLPPPTATPDVTPTVPQPITKVIKQEISFKPTADCTTVKNVDSNTYVMRCTQK